MEKTLVTAPTSKPISLSEAKLHLRVTENDDDKLINSLIAGATEQVEDYLWRKLVTQTWDVFYDCFEYTNDLPFGTLQSVALVKYYDTNDSLQTLATSVYQVNTDANTGQFVLVSNQTWPSIYSRVNPIEVRIICGYGAASAVPDSIKSAIKIKVELMYGNLFENERSQLMTAYESLLNQYRMRRF